MRLDHPDSDAAWESRAEGLKEARTDVLVHADYNSLLVSVDVLIDAGWSAEVYFWLETLADHARSVSAHIALLAGNPTLPLATRRLVIERLVEIAENATRAGCQIEDLAGWLALIACETDGDRSKYAIREVSRWPRGAAQEWTEVLGTAAPWAWAAGFTRADAFTAWRAGDLTESGLHVLAGLRGYLPPPSLDLGDRS